MKLLFGPTLGLVLRPTYLRTLEVAIFYQRGAADCRGHVEANLLVLDETVLPVVLVAFFLLLGGVRREICDVAPEEGVDFVIGILVIVLPRVIGMVTLYYLIILSLLDDVHLL